jgi:multimeric flavodoxin WrbA
MNIAVFHGSPRKGNTHKATKIFMDEMAKQGDVGFAEFFLPAALPVFCTGCQLCMGNAYDNCPHAGYTEPILAAILKSDALIFATPHYSCTMSGAMKNLLDHLDFLTMTVAPRKEIFLKRAFIITTATGSAAAVKPIKRFLLNWGINRVYSLSIRMFIDKWDKMPEEKQLKHERRLRKAAYRFYYVKAKPPYLSSIIMYYVFRFILKRYIGDGNYPFEYWEEQGFFTKRPY